MKLGNLFRNGIFGFIAALIFVGALAADAEAVQIRKVQTFTVYFDADDIDATYDLPTPVNDQAKSIIILTNRNYHGTGNANRDQRYGFTALFEDNGTVLIQKNGSNAATSDWGRVTGYVVEFTDGVRVQRGFTTIKDNTSGYNKNIDLPYTFALDKTFVILQGRTNMTTRTTTEQAQGTATLVDTDTINVHRGFVDSGVKSVNYVYQVVEFQKDAKVRRGTATIGGTSASGTDTITSEFSQTAVSDLTKTFIIVQARPTATNIDGVDAQVYVRVSINGTDKDTLTFTRGAAGGQSTDDLNIAWYVVELTDPSSLSQNNLASATFGTGSLTSVPQSQTITYASSGGVAIDATRAAPIVSTSCSANVDEGADDCQVAVEVTNTTILFKRYNAAQTTEPQTVSSFTPQGSTNTEWWAVEFCPLTLTSPNGDLDGDNNVTTTDPEIWKVGQTVAITWKHADSVLTGGTGTGGKHKVKLLLSVNGGSSYLSTAIAGDTGGGQAELLADADTYSWTIPAKIGTTNIIDTDLRVKIVDTDMSARNEDYSNFNFTIKGQLTMAAPTGGQSWTVGSTQTVSWNNQGDFNGLSATGTLYWSTAGSGGPWTIAKKTDGSNANDLNLGTDPAVLNNFSWKVEDLIDPGNNVFFKIQLNSEASPVQTYSVTAAAINVKRGLAVTVPNTAVTWQSQTSQDITWDYKGQTNFGTVKLQYTIDNGVTVPWPDVAGATALAVNNGSPVGDNPPYDGKGKFSWAIPSTVFSSGANARIRIISNTDGSILDESDVNFTITPSLRVTKPNTAETVFVGDAYNSPDGITWVASGSISNVWLFYSTDPGHISWTPVDNGSGISASLQKLAWTVPAAVSSTVQIKIQDAASSPTYVDTSDVDFTIKAKVASVQPNSSGYFINEQIPVKWTPAGNLGNVRILLSANNDFTTWPTVIRSSVAGGNDGQQQTVNWDPKTEPLPNGITAGVPGVYKIKVELIGDETNVFGISSGSFKVKGVLGYSLPATGGADPTWVINHAAGYRVQWTKDPTGLGNVALYYTKDTGSGWTAITLNGTNQSNGYIDWVPPSAAFPTSSANKNRFKVELVGYETDTNAISRDVMVRPLFAVTSPNGNSDPNLTDVFKVTDGVTVDWDSRDEAGVPNDIDVGEVKIYYSTDGATFPGGNLLATLASSTSPATNTSVTMPIASESDTVKFRLASTNYADLYDDSTYNVKVKPKLQLTRNDGSIAVWKVDDPESVKWKLWTANSFQIRLDYSTAGDAGPWTEFAGPLSSLDTNGTETSYAWPGVPDQIGTNVKLRVRKSTDPIGAAVIYDNSDTAFEIRGAFDFVNPPPAGPVPLLRVGGSYTIQWTNHGTLPSSPNRDVKLYYYTGSYNEITTLTNDWQYGNHSFTWNNIPDAARGATKFKVEWAGDPTNYQKDSSAIQVKPSVTLVATNSSSEVHIDGTLPIQFKHTGRNTDSFNLYYKANNAASWTLINGTPITGVNPDPTVYTHSPVFTIPDDTGIVGNEFKLKVDMVGETTDVVAQSSGVINVYGQITVNAASGAPWSAADTTRQIGWTRKGITEVDIYYSKDNGTDGYPYPIASNVTGTSYAWNPIPAAAVSDQVRVKLIASDSFDSLTTGTQASSFIIKPKLVLTAPNGPATRYVDDPITVTWSSSGAGTVKIQYSSDAPHAVWTDFATNVDSDQNPQQVSGSVPNAISDTVKFRITNVGYQANANLQVTSESATDFPIKGKLDLGALSSTYTLRDSPNVSWTPHGTIGNVTVEYYDGSAWTTVTTTAPQAGPHQFTLNNPVTTKATDAAKVRISATNGSAPPVESATAFTVKPYIAVTGPAANDGWVVDETTRNLTWDQTCSNCTNVKIEFSSDDFAGAPTTIFASTLNDGTQAWSTAGGAAYVSAAGGIPDNIVPGFTHKVRVSSLLGTAYDVAVKSGGFKIKGELAMKVPNDATPVKWDIGTTKLIEWTNVHGSVANVKLYYSTAGDGGPFSALVYQNGASVDPVGTVASGAPGDHSYSWAIPNNFTIVKNNFRLKVEDAADNSVTDPSTAASSTLAKFAWTHPAVGSGGVSGEVVTAEESYTIEWSTALPSVPTEVKLEYNVGPGWVAVTENEGSTPNDGIIANDGIFNLTVPSTRTSGAKMRLSDPSDSDSAKESSTYKIKGKLTIDPPLATGSPLDGDQWGISVDNNDTRLVRWKKKGNIGSVKLQFTKDTTAGPIVWEALPDGTTPTAQDTQNIDTTGSANGPFNFNWVIPNVGGITTTKARMRVLDNDDPTLVYGDSGGTFTIKGSITLTSPTGAGDRAVGDSITVSGSVFGPINPVRAFYTRSGSIYDLNGVLNQKTDIAVSSGSYSTTVNIPDLMGSGITVTVEDPNNSQVNQVSTPFAIKGKIVQFDTPTTASTAATPAVADEAYTVQWDKKGSIGNVAFYYDPNNSGTWTLLDLEAGGQASAVASPADNNNTLTWHVPNSVTPGSTFRIKVTNAAGVTDLIADYISEPFTVKGRITIGALSANYTLRDQVNATWTVKGQIGLVTVEYYNGSSWYTVATDAPQGGPKLFTLNLPVTDVATDQAKVRVNATTTANAVGASTSPNFTVKPYIAVTSPAANDGWVVDETTRNLTWDQTCSNCTNVKIEFSSDDFASAPTTIFASTLNDGTQAWSTAGGAAYVSAAGGIPDNISSAFTHKVRVSSLLGTSYDVAVKSGGFKIKGELAMKVPNDATPVKWDIGTTKLIEWTNVHGSVANVKLYYSTAGDGGPFSALVYQNGASVDPVGTVASGAPGDHSYSWAIPNNFTIVKNNFRLKVEDAADNSVTDPSTAASSTLAKFAWTHPAVGSGGVSGEVVTAEESYTIEWSTALPSVPTEVKLEYNVGPGWVAVTENEGSTPNDGIIANDGIFNLTVPSTRTSGAKMRLSDPSDSDSAKESSTYKIKGKLTIDPPLATGSPLDGDQWGISVDNNDTRLVRWKKKGNIGSVKLQFTKDTTAGPIVWEALPDGTTPTAQDTQNIDTTGSANGPFNFNWVIPNVGGITTTKARMRVLDNDDPTLVYGDSGGTFTIKGSITLTSPTGAGDRAVGDSITVSGSVFGPINPVRAFYTRSGSIYDLNGVLNQKTDIAVSSGSYSTTVNIPDLMGSGITVTVEDPNNSQVNQVSTPFAIKGKIVQFDTPTTASTAATPAVADEAYTVQWDKKGSIGNVAFYYDPNNSGTWTLLDLEAGGQASAVASPADNNNTLTWHVPNSVTPGSTFRIKVTNAAGVTDLIADYISEPFTVKGRITIGALSANYTLRDQVNATWTVKGQIGLVTVEYYNGSSWYTVATDAPQGGPKLFTLNLPVTDVATDQAKVRVNATTTANAVGASTSPNFTVKPYIAVTSPAANDGWVVDETTRNLTWDQTCSNCTNVKIEFSSDDFASAPTTIFASTLNDGTQAWSTAGGAAYVSAAGGIPDNISSAFTHKVRVSSLLGTSYDVAVKSGGFKIKGELAMKVPNDATPVKWDIGTTKLIEWTNVHGSVANVKLYYSTAGDGGPFSALVYQNGASVDPVGTVASGAPGDHSYSWAIPNNFTIVKNNFRLKVEDAADNSVTDPSTAASSTLAKFAWTHPAVGSGGVSGEVVTAEESYTIEWSTALPSVPTEVKLEYNVGPGWVAVTENEGSTPNDGIIANDGIFNLTVPSTRTSGAKMRLSDPSDSDSAKESSTYKIKGKLTIDPPLATGSPLDGDQWGISVDNNDTRLVRWKKKGNIGSVKLQFTKDTTAGPIVWEALPDGTTPTAQDTQNIDTTGSANGPFNFNWVIPNVGGITTTKARMRVLDNDDPTLVYGDSGGTFTIKGSITLTSPTGAGDRAVGDSITVSGSVFGPINPVRAFYTRSGSIYDLNGVLNQKTDIAVSSGSYSTTVNIPDLMGSGITVTVEDPNNSQVNQVSTPFAIKGKIVQFDTPTTASTAATPAVADEAYTVQWDKKGSIGNVAFYYDPNNSGTWTLLDLEAGGQASAVASPADNNNTLTWHVPNSVTPGSTFRIKVTNAAGVTDLIADYISEPFTVKGRITIGALSANYTLRDQVNATWTVKGQIGLVTVEYYNGSSWYTVATDAPQGGPKLFTLNLPVTDVATDQAKVRVNATTTANAVGASTSPNFTVKPYIAVTGPAANDGWVVDDTTRNISWDQTCSNCTNVKIEFSSDDFATAPTTIFASTLNDGSQAWSTAGGASYVSAAGGIPDNIVPGFTHKVRVSSLLGTAYDVAIKSGGFKIKGELAMTVPSDATAVQWRIDTTQLIEWDRVHGSVANIKLFYSTAGDGGPWSALVYQNGATVDPVGTRPGADESYTWAIPKNFTIVKDNFRLKIEDAADNSVVDPSTAVSSIWAKFGFTHPVTGDVWVAENSHTIEWTTPEAGVPANVKIEYSTNGTDWFAIAENEGTPNDGIVANDGTQPWVVTSTRSNSAKVRISDANDSASIFLSQPFKIRGDLTVTDPNGNSDPQLTNVLTVTETYYIKWTKKGNIPTLQLDYSNTGADPYTLITTPTNATGVDATTGAVGWGWLVPDDIGSTVKVKIMDESDPTLVYDTSNFNFIIQGRILYNPVLPATLYVRDDQSITISKDGTISTVKVEYSLNGAPYVYAKDPAGNDLDNVSGNTFTWRIPDTISTNVVLRVSNTNALKPTLAATSGTLAIKGRLTMDTPTLNEKPMVDETYALKWTPTGTLGTVKLEYSTDNFTLPQNIYPVLGPANESAATLPAGNSLEQQTFLWKIPDLINNTVKVRVSPNTASQADPNSSAQFQIVGGFVLSNPNGGAGVFYEVDASVPIQWEKHGTIVGNQALLEYSTNGFLNESQTFAIATVAASDLSRSWTIPNLASMPGTTVKVRISDPAYNGSTVFSRSDTSTNNFEIRSKVAFEAPNADAPLGGEVWLIGEDRTVKFTKHGTVPSVKIEYKVGANAYALIKDSSNNEATGITGNTFPWRIPDDKGLNNVVVRVTNLSDDDVVVVSSPFTIRAGFNWTNPTVAGTVFENGTTAVLNWSTFGTVTNVDLKYSTNGDPVYDGDTDPNYQFMKDASNTNADNIVNNGTFNWPIPNVSPTKDLYLVVVDSSDSAAQKVSVKCKIAGVLAVDEPDNDPSVERWGVGTNQFIRWTMTGSVANVKIEYTKDITAGPVVWETPAITDSTVGSNLQYQWTNIPTSAVTAKAAIRISDVITDSGTVAKISPMFKVVGTFNVTAPATNNVWATSGTSSPAGTITNPDKTIVWTTNGTIAQAKVSFSTTGNSPGSFSYLNGGNPINDGGAGGSFSWTIPNNIISNNVVVRVEDNTDNLTYNDSGVFTIRGDLALTEPAAGRIWGVGENHSITWDTLGIVGSPNEVYLFYKKGAGGSWIQIEKPTGGYNIPNSGAFTWNPAETELSEDAYVKVESIFADSDSRYKVSQSGSFKLKRRYQLLDPDGGEIYTVGTPKDITWNKWGSPAGDVRIDLAADGVNFTTSISNNTPNDGVFSWTPQAADISTTAKIRIADVTDTAFENAYISQSPFIVRGVFTLDAMPATVKIANVFDILWTRLGNVPNVKIQYSTTGNFATDSRNIEDENGVTVPNGLVPNQDSVTGNPTRGRHRWKVPDLVNTERNNLILRVVDPNDDPGSQNISNSFKAIPSFTVTFPNGNSDPNLTDKLKVGQIYSITWSSSSAADASHTPRVKVMFSTDGTNYFPADVIAGDTANGYPNGSVDWNYNGADNGGQGVPNRITTQLKVKVEELGGDPNAFDQSDNNCKIISNLTLNSPGNALGQVYTVGQTTPFDWSNIGSAGIVYLMYSTNGNDFSSPFYLPDNAGTPGVPNEFANTSPYDYTWTVPDKIGTNVRVRVKSKTDDGDAVAANNIRIKGKLEFNAANGDTPTAGQKANIGQAFPIKWTTTGTIPQVDIVWDRFGGLGDDQLPGTGDEFNRVLANDLNNTGTFNWPSVSDLPTSNAVIRVRDSRDALNSPGNDNSDVYGDSPAFNIVGNFTIVAPNGNEDWRVGTPQNIIWQWGGTIPVVKLYYSKNTAADPATLAITGDSATGWKEIDPAVTKDYSADGLGNGSGGVTRSYAWTIPDDISPNARVMVADSSNVDNVRDYSNNFFKIRGVVTLTAPLGNTDPNLTDRWVTSVFTVNEGRDITWTSAGTMPLVKIQYSNDNFVSDINPILDPSDGDQDHANDGSFTWEVPDIVLKDGNNRYTGPRMVKIRVLDANDSGVYSQSNFNIKIDYYQVTWEIRDLGTYALMADCSVVETKSIDPNFIQWQEGAIAVQVPDDPGPPAVVGYVRKEPTPAGSWIATWKKTGYGDFPQSVTLTKTNTILDPVLLVLMETTVIHITRSEVRFTYDPDAKRLDITAWRERDGALQTGILRAEVDIYEGSTQLGGGPVVLTALSGGLGLWTAAINNADQAPWSLVAGKTYNAVARTQNASQAPNSVWTATPATFEITTPSKLEETRQAVEDLINVSFPTFQTAIQATLDAQTQTIVAELDQQTALIQQSLDNFEALISDSIDDLQDAATQSLAAADTLEATALKFSWKGVVAPNPALVGDKVTIQVQGPAGLFPKLSIYNQKNVGVVINQDMKEDSTRPGSYSYEFAAASGSFPPGQAYTWIVVEDVQTFGLTAGSGFVESMSITTVAGLAAAAPAAEKSAKEAVAAIRELEASMAKGGDVRSALKNLQKTMNELPTEVAKVAGGDTKRIRSTVNEISERLQRLAGDQGLDMSQLVGQALEESASVQEIRSRTDNIVNSMELMGAVIEKKMGGVDDPIVATFLE